MFSHGAADSSPAYDLQLEQLSEVDRRQDEFFAFLDDELLKIETFYRLKETEASERLQVLRQQLHIMRDQRMEDFLATKSDARHSGEASGAPSGLRMRGSLLIDLIQGRGRLGKNSQALAQMAAAQSNNTELLPQQQQQQEQQQQQQQQIADRRDFTRRREHHQHPEVSYRSAKRKLKYALQEYYRGLELLKSYAYMNRTAFRKINKKYDKTVNAHPTMRYMAEKVNQAWFVQSDIVETLIVAVEDLYTRYFERGNRKIAIAKLRRTVKKRAGDYSSSAFMNGLMGAAGTLLTIQALIYAVRYLRGPDPVLQIRTSYLLQVSHYI